MYYYFTDMYEHNMITAYMQDSLLGRLLLHAMSFVAN